MELVQSHPFWFVLAVGCVAWYSTITVYVAIKGVKDIKTMLRNLAKSHGGGQ